ncbi:N-acetylmuramoyl-L-alanine amidase family protein [Selenomonas sp. oral taxon 136]|uniref:N-acetylmuramoyl-L-alanine amidase family protein n=1 Tax=Selenomonas sp. oral taxon 136 TaxID=713030 RepID=UPI0007680767|nr:N-acetylmuramoyl-L-alanine amidase [Selenomonas sp. oral taxon 136]AME02657.1 N-acetylmuramoyl-L-alanine amidase [Selenomonas sp. oral taxon 136]
MKVFLNPGHAPNGNPDPGACGYGLRECDVAKNVADLVAGYLAAAGVEVVGSLQSDSLHEVVTASNRADADVFISIHCNACNGSANGTEVWHYYGSGEGEKLADCIQNQIVDALGTVDRGVKGAKPGVNGLYVLNNTDAVAVLVELAFIDNESDATLLRERQDEFARAIARGVTDYALQ